MSIRIITDSACDMSFEGREDVTVLPLGIAFGDETFQDGVNLSHHEFYEKLIETDELPVTSQVTPAQFERALSEAAEAGEDILIITISGKLSGTMQSALIAANATDAPVHLVDSENVAMGQAILVRRACELVDEGMSVAEVARVLDREKKDIRLVALLDTLEYLKRGGRISSAAAAIGGVLTIKPVIAIEGGEVVILGKARGSRKGNNLLVEQIEKTQGIDFDRPYQLGYTGLDDHLLRKYVEDSRSLWEGHADDLPINVIGGAIGTHTGPGAIGVAFFARA